MERPVNSSVLVLLTLPSQLPSFAYRSHGLGQKRQRKNGDKPPFFPFLPQVPFFPLSPLTTPPHSPPHPPSRLLQHHKGKQISTLTVDRSPTTQQLFLCLQTETGGPIHIPEGSRGHGHFKTNRGRKKIARVVFKPSRNAWHLPYPESSTFPLPEGSMHLPIDT